MGVRRTETCLVVWSGGHAAAGDGAVGLLQTSPIPPEPPDPLFDADAFYDAGDRGCAEGPLDRIAALMRSLEPGQTLEVRATDPTVATDLPAWCRMTGHAVVDRQGSRYLIRCQ